MAPSLKLSLLALVGAAAAVPGHGHDKFHKRHNYPMTNSTTSIAADVPADAATTPLPAIATHVYLNTSSVADAQMTSSGAAHVSSAAADAAAGTSMYPNEAAGSASKANAAPADATAGSSAGAAGGASSDSTTTQTSTKTRTQTVTMKKPQGTGAAAQPSPPALNADVPSNNDVADNAQCGPETVTVTAVEKVTVTVQPNVQPNSKKPNRKTTVVYVTAEPATSGAAAISEGSPAPSEAPAQSPVNTKPAVESPAPAVTPTDGGKPPAAPTGVSGSSAAVETSAGAGYPAPSSQASESEVATPTASSSASARPSSPPTASMGKRGLVYPFDGGAQADKTCKEKECGFCTSWEGWTKFPDMGQNKPISCPFIPMCRTRENGPAFKADVEANLARGGPKAIFGFNEPDKGEQANMDPGTACSAWKEYIFDVVDQNPGLDVMSPSVCSGSGPDEGLNWLKKFMDTCEHAHQITTLNIHWYSGSTEAGKSPGKTQAEGLKAHIENFRTTFPGWNFYLSEFGWVNTSGSDADAAEFLTEILPWLDAQTDCKGYAYFMSGTDGNHRALGTIDNMTEAGKAYFSS